MAKIFTGAQVEQALERVKTELDKKAPGIYGLTTDAEYTTPVLSEKQIMVYGNTFEHETVKIANAEQAAVFSTYKNTVSGISTSFVDDNFLINGTATKNITMIWTMTAANPYKIPEQLKGKKVTLRFVSDKPCTMVAYSDNNPGFRVNIRKTGQTGDPQTRVTKYITGGLDNAYLDMSVTFTVAENDDILIVLPYYLGAGSTFDQVRVRMYMYEYDAEIYDTGIMLENGEERLLNIPDGYHIVDTGCHKNAGYGVVDTKEYIDSHVPDNMVTVPILQEYIPTKENLRYITPEMFGAVGDGIADDTVAFQNALNAIRENTPFRAYGKYKTTAGLVIRGDDLDIYINKIDYRGSGDAIITISGSYNNFVANSLYGYFGENSVGLRYETTATYHARYSNIHITNIYSQQNCIEILNQYGKSDTKHEYYNRFYLMNMYSSYANCIYTNADAHLGENSFWAKHISCGNGYAFYAEMGSVQASTNRLYEFCIESSCMNGVHGLAGLVNCRTSECMGRKTLAHPETGNIFVIEGRVSGPPAIIHTPIMYACYDNSNAASFEDWVQYIGNLIENASGSESASYITIRDRLHSKGKTYKAASGSCYLWPANADPVHQGSGDYGNVGTLLVYYNHKGFVPSFPVKETIVNSEYHAMMTTAIVPTIFDIGVTGTIYLDYSYCAVGINKITVIQRDGYKTTIYAKDGETVIFNGTALEDGTYKLTCTMYDLDELRFPVPRMTGGEYVARGYSLHGLYTGSNETWTIEKLNIISQNNV